MEQIKKEIEDVQLKLKTQMLIDKYWEEIYFGYFLKGDYETKKMKRFASNIIKVFFERLEDQHVFRIKINKLIRDNKFQCDNFLEKVESLYKIFYKETKHTKLSSMVYIANYIKTLS